MLTPEDIDANAIHPGLDALFSLKFTHLTNNSKPHTIILLMKKLSALIFSTATYLSLTPIAFAQDFGPVDPCADNPGGGLNFASLCGLGSDGVGPLISNIITILFIVAVLLAIGFLVYGGIKWIMSGGDKGKVEAARGTIVAALVGLVLVFVSYFIINFVLQLFDAGSLTGGNIVIPNLVD